MKIKITHALLSLLIITSIISCKKDSPSGSDDDSYIKIKKNGTWVTYKALGELGPDLDDATKTNFGITGVSSDQKERFDITVQVDGTTFNTGTYDSDNSDYWLDVSYWELSNNGAADKLYDLRSIDGQPESKYTLVVESITNTHLKGRFTGNYLTDNFSNDDPVPVQITEGEYYVKRIR